MRAFRSVLGRALEGGAIAGFALASLYVAARVGLEPRDPTHGVGVVFAPWTGADAAFIRAVEAGARFVRFGGVPFIVVVEPEASDYLDRVRAAGAWLIVDPVVMTACLPPSSAIQVSK